MLRYFDVKKSFLKPDYNFYILGRLRLIPEQKILEALLISEGIKPSKINVIYKENETTRDNILYISNLLRKNSVKEIIFLTSPYNTLRSKLIWEKNVKDIDAKFYRTIDWPSEKYIWFERALNKKIILYEYLAIIYNRLKGFL